YHISSPDFDLYALQAEMEIFCEKHMLSRKVTDYALHIAEEVLILQNDYSDISLGLSYSEKDGSLELECRSTGLALNPLGDNEFGDDIGIRLIKARCKSMDYVYENGENILLLKLKVE
ncbi:MAG: hypothetical protein ACOYN4_19310, partial [Bacteroidales bacterium]